MNNQPQLSPNYNNLISQIGDLLLQGRRQAAYAVNNILVQTYWEIGKYIVEFEQGGTEKSEYGSKLLDRISKDLTVMYGKGFSRSNLFNIRLFYAKFSKIQTLSGQFSETVSHQFKKEAVQKVCHPALDAGSPKKRTLIIRGLRFKPAMTIVAKRLLRQPQLCVTLSHKLNRRHYVDILNAEYALDNITNQLFVSKYQLFLPAKEDLERELERLLENKKYYDK
jgi:hypothetical protein